jgi:hypothetical protein
VHTVFFKSNHRLKSSDGKSDQDGYSSSLYPPSHSAKCDEHWFHRCTTALSQTLFGDYVKTCNAVSKTSILPVELRGRLRVPCSHFALCHQPWTYHATGQTVTCAGGVFQIRFSVFALHSHSPFPVAFQNKLTLLKCQSCTCHFFSHWPVPSNGGHWY